MGRGVLTLKLRKGRLLWLCLGEDDTHRCPEFLLDSPYEVDEIPLRMTHFVREETALVGKARVLVATEVDVGRLALEQKDEGAVGALQMLLVTANRETGEFWRYDQRLDLKLSAETRDQLSRTWLPVVRDFELAPGRYEAKIVNQPAAPATG